MTRLAILIIVTFMAHVGLIHGQPCSLTVKQSPKIRGIQLGMTTAQVLKLFPGTSADPTIAPNLERAHTNFGRAQIGIKTVHLPESMSSMVNNISLHFMDDRLSSLWIEYKSIPWRSPDELIVKLSEALGLPGPTEWRGEGSVKTLDCADGLRISANGHRSGTAVWLVDLSADKLYADRKAAAEEQARRDFKP